MPGATHWRPREPLALALSAIRNASTVPVEREMIVPLLRSGEGEPSHLGALFGDVPFAALARLAAETGVSSRELWDAYRLARQRSAARNPELEAWGEELFGD